MEIKKLKVALLTAGLAPENFERAAKRVIDASAKLYEFEEVLVLGVDSLERYCPVTAQRYREFLRPEIRGFGHWIWKPEFIYRTLSGEFGRFDQVIWVDSGCEINVNGISKAIFARRIVEADEKGFWLHALSSSDYQYSKRSVISQFPELSEEQLKSPQIQANYMHLSTHSALPLAEEWFTFATTKISNVNLEVMDNENPTFIEHRSDQSILSLSAKKRGLQYNQLNLPNGRSLRSAIRGISEPIWISRNRDGKSLIPRIIRLIP